MSDNKKYYYIKLKDNYFEQDNVKVMESMPNGFIYSLIIIKLYLKSTKYGGQLRMTDSIPYDPSKINILSNVLGHDVAHVKEAIKLACELDIITIMESGDIWMSEIQNFIGNSSSEADRKRAYRRKITAENNEMGHLSDERPPKKEIEKEKKKELKLELETELDNKKNKQKKSFKKWTKEDLIEDMAKYPKHQMYFDEFLLYWTEEDPNGKMRFQLNKTWSTGGRLTTWSKNNFGQKSFGQQEFVSIYENVGQKI